VTQPTKFLPSRFRRALLYVVEALGSVSVTKLQKVLYLADLEHHALTGTTMTGARWVRYTHGPMAKALLPSTQVMDGHEIEVSNEPVGPYDARVYRPGPAPRFRPNLAPEEKATLDRILALIRQLTTKDAIALAYNTAPMRLLQRIEGETGQIQLDVEIPFELDEATIADVASPEPAADVAAVVAFKRRERERVRDLQEAAVARASR
jgi:hypothetical protein